MDEVLIEKNRAVGVRMADGKELRAETIISGAGVVNTWTKLLPEATIQKHKLDQHLQKVNPSVAHICLYIRTEWFSFRTKPSQSQLLDLSGRSFP
ncbi:MAG: hypothetical protein R3B93_15565 [Bacteroidia bacterium]